MNWDDHYTTHKFQGLFLIQTERYLQTELDEIRSKEKSKPPVLGKFINHLLHLLRTLTVKERILFASNHLVHRYIDANKCNSFVQILRAVELAEPSQS